MARAAASRLQQGANATSVVAKAAEPIMQRIFAAIIPSASRIMEAAESARSGRNCRIVFRSRGGRDGGLAADGAVWFD